MKGAYLKTAIENLKNHNFRDYDVEFEWFNLLEVDDQYWYATRENGKYYFYIDEVKIAPLGKELSKYIWKFIEEKEEEKEADRIATIEHQEHLKYLHRNFGVGMI